MEKKILIVDDEKMICEMLEEAFSSKGYIAHSAESAETALDFLQQEEIQVIFIDLKLPEMDGVQLCKKVKQDKPASIIYAFTGYTSLFQFQECRDAGFDYYFTKPLRLNVLLKAAQNAFQRIERLKERRRQIGF